MRNLTGSDRNEASEIFAAVEDLVENKAPLTEYQAYTDRIRNLAPRLSAEDKKRLAFELVALGRLVVERPWDPLPGGYVPEDLILVRAPNGSHRVNIVNDRRVARLWLLPICAGSLGAVVAEILWHGAGGWSLEDLEALLHTSGGPFLKYYRYDHGWTRTSAYDYKHWPWGVGGFAARLGEHGDEPGFRRMLERFLTEVFVWAYQGNSGAVPQVLALAGRHEGGLRLLFDKLEAIEGDRLSFMEEIDLARVDNALRFRLSAQIIHFLARNRRPVRQIWGQHDEYERVLKAIGCRGMDEYVREVERKEIEGLTGVGGTARGNLFTGEDHFDGPHGKTWMWTEAHLAEIRSLAKHPPERPGNPRISREDFLGHFSAEQLKRTYFDMEDPYPSKISRKWRALWLATGRDPEATAALLTAFYEYPEQKTLSSVPPEGWWNRWGEATAPLDSEVIREACDATVRAAIGERTSYRGPEDWFSADRLLDRLSLAAVYGVTTVATPSTCERLAAVVQEPRKFGEPMSIAAARALERIGSREALFELQNAKMRVKNKNVLRPVEDCLIRLADERGTDPETLADLTAESFGLGLDGVREWHIGDYAGEVRLSEDGKVIKGFRNTMTGKTLRSVPKAAKATAPESLQEITAVHKKLREGYTVQKVRLEAAMVSGRTWKLAEWQQAFLANPLMNNLARRLVWRVAETPAMPDGSGGWRDAEGVSVKVIPDAEVRLMHPVTAPSVELAPWRRCIVANGLVQPFKQVFRETYAVTPAERETHTHSYRFAAHVVNHRRVYALLKERGWSGMYMLGEHEEPAHKDYPSQMVCALFDHSGEMDIGNVDGSDWFVLDHVWFVRLSRHGRQLRGGETLPLSDVHPIVFSEAMRDVDLFVATAGIGTDPDWEDWETRRARDAAVWAERRAAYEQEWAATADQRAALLHELLGPLGVEERVRLEGRFAIIRGSLANYRVHLGSGNVHTEPDGRYVCIVPVHEKSEDPYLPFEEGDLKTAEIISKILALSADDKIEDESILRQIRP